MDRRTTRVPWRSLARRAGVVASVLATALFAVPVPVQADSADATQEEVYAGLGLDDVYTHYVVLIDISGSMQKSGLYNYVRADMGKFAEALAPDDTLTMMTFAEKPTDPCIQGRVYDPQDVVNCLPAKATKKFTDIGQAVDGALWDIKEEAAPVSVLLLVSDGDHIAGPESDFGKADVRDPHWAALRKEAALMPHLYAYALQLGKSTSARTLRVVFPTATTLNATSPDEVRAKLNPPKKNVRDQFANSLLSSDIGGGVTLGWGSSLTNIDAANGFADVQLTVQSRTKYLPLTMTGVGLRQVDGTAVKVQNLPDRIDLAPGIPFVCLVRISWPAGSWPQLTSKGIAVNANLELTGEVSSPWDTVLNQRGLKRTTVVTGTRTLAVSGTGIVERSTTQLVFFPIGLLAFVIAGCYLVRFLRARRSGVGSPVWQQAVH